MVQIKIIVNDEMDVPFISEHGLSLALYNDFGLTLFDTGQGLSQVNGSAPLVHNAQVAGVDLSTVSQLVFSHGHYDHTGGFVALLEQGAMPDVYFAPGLTVARFSRHVNMPVKNIAIPDVCRRALESYPAEKKHLISMFTEIEPGMFLTGPIPRISGEDVGGPFFLDPDGTRPDPIADEQAILFADGTLVVGCCHAGIINTVRYCQYVKPEIKIRKIIGGLHLLHASQERIDQTKSFLDSLNLEELTAIHCTGKIDGINSECGIRNSELNNLAVHNSQLATNSTQYAWTFSWLGKDDARQQAFSQPKTCPQGAVPASSDSHLYIEADNLDALKWLLPSWSNRIKMIYIDPPYNTGKNAFLYDDNFRKNIGNYKRQTGIKQLDTTQLQGRFHTDWLNMIYPRLLLSRELLSPQGAIFISIDDTEVHNLRKLCDEIFGEENFIANFIWQTTKGAQGICRKKMLVANHEHILCYAKDERQFTFRGIERSDETFSNPDNDPRGLWKRQYLQRFGRGFTQRTIVDPNTGRSYTFPTPYSEQKINELIADNRIIFPKRRGYPCRKEFYNEYPRRQQITTFLGLFSTKTNTQRINRLFDGVRIFNTPKPTELLECLIDATTDANDVILDFFSGSGTTGHAVINLNRRQQTKRQFILIQSSESCDENSDAYKAGYHTIFDIGLERIRRVNKQNEPMEVVRFTAETKESH